MTTLFVPRSTWFTGTPTNNNGTARPPLAFPVPTITVHYTGMPSLARARTQSAQEFMPPFQLAAKNRNPQPASFEYNYVIPPRADGSSQVWEYAGTYRAAHSAGENDIAVGVLFCIGVDNHPSYSTYDPTRPTVWEPLTDAMVDAYHWLRDVHLPRIGAVSKPTQVEHRNMAGAVTACPGNSVIARWSAVTGTTPVPTPIPPEEPVVVTYFKTAADALTVWATSDGLNAVRLEGFHCTARGVDPAKVAAIPQAEADKFVYHFGATAQSVK